VQEHLKESLLQGNAGSPVGLELTSGSGQFVLICESVGDQLAGLLLKYGPEGLVDCSRYADPMEALSVALEQGFTENARGTYARFSGTTQWKRGMRDARRMQLLASLGPGAGCVTRAIGIHS